ncbi:MAG TPA: sulfite exporter TauE/SafE family protein [Flavipsychrobacter sp.]
MIGISLGLIGGGGSILTVPVLVYLFHIDATQATSYSLFIVGLTSLIGAYLNYRKQQVDVRTALLFGLSSITTVFLTRKFLIPAIPNVLFSIGDIEISRAIATMVLFAILMVLAAVSMIRNNNTKQTGTSSTNALSKLLLFGVGIGLITGLLGAGGGFLIIPALVLVLHIPMKKAVGTSLLIIALNSLIGFTGDIGQQNIDWAFLLLIAAVAIAGIIIGTWLSRKIAGTKLKKGFGWFVLTMGTYILIKELLLN